MQSVRDYMIPKIITVSDKSLLLDALKLMKEHNISSVLVSNGVKKVIGIFTERDLLLKIDWRKLDTLTSLKLSHVMTKNLKVVKHDMLYTDVLNLMQKHKIRHMPVSEGGKIIGIVSLRDLLNRHQEYLLQTLKDREEALWRNIHKVKESEERFRMIFHNSAVGIMLTDKDEKIVAWNPFAAKLLGMDEQELRGRPVKDLYPAEEWNRIRAQKIRELGIKHHFETKMIHKQKGFIDVGLSISVLKDAKKQVIGSIGIVRDITEHKKLERIRQEFVGVVSHELRTPLVPIREGVSQVLEGILGNISVEQKEFLSITLDEIDRLRRIIDNLLDMFKLEVGAIPVKKELVALNDIVNEVIAAFAAHATGKHLELRSRFSRDTIQAYVDKDRLMQVFANLVGNALKFTKEGSIEISVIEKKDIIECCVSDTGRGIPHAELSRLFQKFSQVGKRTGQQEAGTGLGLVICKDIIALHKGRIWVESAFRKGTKFKFSLPILNTRQVYEDYLSEYINAFLEGGEVFSAAVFTLEGDDAGEGIDFLNAIVAKNLRRRRDIVLKDCDRMLTLLPTAAKDTMAPIIARIQKSFQEEAVRCEAQRNYSLGYRVTHFPEDGDTVDKLLKKLALR